jgi:Bacterial Ig-like domain (group 2)
MPSIRFSSLSSLLVILAAGWLLAACKETNAPEATFSITPDSGAVLVGEGLQFSSRNAPGPIVWSSNNSQVASVVAETGYAVGTGRGTATISAISGGTVAQARLTVSLPPAIGLSVSTFEFSKVTGGSDPANQTLTVTNAGDGDLPNITVGPVTYGEGQPGGWLTVASAGTTAPLVVTLTARQGSLGRGIYTATLPVASPGIDNSPQSVAVTFRVNDPPSIVLSRSLVQLATIPASTASSTVDVTNGGDVPLTGLTALVTYGVGPQGWLSATLDATTAPAILTLTANSGSLAIGNYTATARISSSVPGVPVRDVAVQFTVNPGPSIVIAPTSLTAFATNGSNAASQTVSISNGGGGTLSGLSVGTISYGGGQPTGWLGATLSTSTAPTTVTVSFNAASLATGTYTATVPIISAVASNSPLNIPVTLGVGPPPEISLSPTNVLFATWGGSPNLPAPQGVIVSNKNAGPLTGLSASVVYNTGASDWLTLQFQGGTSAPTTLLLRPNTTGIGEGLHTATVTVSSNIPGVASKTVTLAYSIQTFVIDLYPGFSSINNGSGVCTNCHGWPAGSTIDVYNAARSRVNPGSPSTSILYQKLAGLVGHGGGTYTGFASIIASWINAGAPYQ